MDVFNENMLVWLRVEKLLFKILEERYRASFSSTAASRRSSLRSATRF